MSVQSSEKYKTRLVLVAARSELYTCAKGRRWCACDQLILIRCGDFACSQRDVSLLLGCTRIAVEAKCLAQETLLLVVELKTELVCLHDGARVHHVRQCRCCTPAAWYAAPDMTHLATRCCGCT